MKISHLCQWSSLQWFLENITEDNLLRLVIQTILEVRRNCPSRELQCFCGRQRKNKARGIHFLTRRDAEVPVLILVLTVFVISIITVMTETWSWNSLENSPYQNAGWENQRTLFWKYGVVFSWQMEQFHSEERLVFVWDACYQESIRWTTREERAFLYRSKWRNTNGTKKKDQKRRRKTSMWETTGKAMYGCEVT